MKKLDITKGIPITEFKTLLSIGEPFQLLGEQIFLFDKEKISRINRAKLQQFQQLQKKENMSVDDIHQMIETNQAFDFDTLKEVNGVVLNKYDKMMLAAGHIITIGIDKVRIQENQLIIEPPVLKKETPKMKR